MSTGILLLKATAMPEHRVGNHMILKLLLGVTAMPGVELSSPLSPLALSVHSNTSPLGMPLRCKMLTMVKYGESVGCIDHSKDGNMGSDLSPL